eukprot:1554050-Rhodomonas_salina.1
MVLGGAMSARVPIMLVITCLSRGGPVAVTWWSRGGEGAGRCWQCSTPLSPSLTSSTSSDGPFLSPPSPP